MALEPITRQEKIIAGQDLTPITRMEKFLKQYGGGSGGVTSWNDLTDKPFGETTTVKEVLAECHQPSNDAITINEPINLVVGSEYIVTFRGVEYRCVAQEIVSDGISFAMLGNGTEMGGTSNGEPFTIVEYPAEIAASTGFIVYILGDGTADYTISIRQEVTEVKKISGKYVEGMGYEEDGVVHPIDPKFLPSGGGGGAAPMVVTLTNGADGFAASHTYAEIEEAIASGRTVYVTQESEDSIIRFVYAGSWPGEVHFTATNVYGFDEVAINETGVTRSHISFPSN